MTKNTGPPTEKGFFGSYKFQAAVGRGGAEEQCPSSPTFGTDSATYVTGPSIHPEAQAIIMGVIFGISLLFAPHSIKSKAFLS